MPGAAVRTSPLLPWSDGQPLEFAARPANDIEIDPFQSWTQLRPVEVAVVADPAADDGIIDLGQILQGFVAAEMKPPTPDFPADARQRLGAGCGQEAVDGLPFATSFSGRETESPGSRTRWQESRRAGSHPCSRRFSSFQDAAPTCRPQSDPQAHSITPAPPQRFCSDKSHRPRSARTGCARTRAPSTCRTRSAGTGLREAEK